MNEAELRREAVRRRQAGETTEAIDLDESTDEAMRGRRCVAQLSGATSRGGASSWQHGRSAAWPAPAVRCKRWRGSWGDVQAVQNGRVGRRVGRRIAGKATGRGLGRLFR
jgi:hypothetical protein